MYRVLVFLLVVLCLTIVSQIVAVTAWRDYEKYGSVSWSRAVEDALPKAANGSAAGGGQDVPGRNPAAGELPGHGPEALKTELFYLVNVERVLARVAPVSSGSDPSVQQHAHGMMTYGYRSHWDVNGLTPHMRYSISGGTNRVRQNIAGPVDLSDYTEGNRPENWRDLAESVHKGLMESRISRANILDRWHGKVTIGVS
ncbi:MAG: hypothetical protein OXN21_15805, partial [Chloroflexota bacterium]|nr:hypothetical protein [Chloroflexota bacterium]